MYTESAIRHRRAVWSWPAQPTALFGGVYGLLVSGNSMRGCQSTLRGIRSRTR